MRLLAAVDLGEGLEVVVDSARFLQEGLGIPAEATPTWYPSLTLRTLPVGFPT